MKALMHIESPEGVQVTLNVTMTLKQWRELKAQLDESYPSWAFGSLIAQAINKVTEVHCAKHDLQAP